MTRSCSFNSVLTAIAASGVRSIFCVLSMEFLSSEMNKELTCILAGFGEVSTANQGFVTRIGGKIGVCSHSINPPGVKDV